MNYTDVLFLLGIILFSVGLGFIYWPLVFLWFGGWFMFLAYHSAKRTLHFTTTTPRQYAVTPDFNDN